MNRDMKHSKGSQAFSVPNSPDGRQFLGLMHKFRQRNWKLVVRARGKRSIGDPGSDAVIDTRSWNQDLPIKYGEWFAVYLREPDRQHLLSLAAYQAGLHRGQHEANLDMMKLVESLRFQLAEALRWDVRTLNTERDVAREMLAEAEREAARLRDQVRGLDTKLSMRRPAPDMMDLVRQAEEDHSDDVCQSCGDVDCHRNHGHIAGEDDIRLGGDR